jgi:hypothetical protein
MKNEDGKDVLDIGEIDEVSSIDSDTKEEEKLLAARTDKSISNIAQFEEHKDISTATTDMINHAK